MHCSAEIKNDDKMLNKSTLAVISSKPGSGSSSSLAEHKPRQLVHPPSPPPAYSFLLRGGQLQLPAEKGKDFSSLSSLCSLSSIILINVKPIPFLSKCTK